MASTTQSRNPGHAWIKYLGALLAIGLLTFTLTALSFGLSPSTSAKKDISLALVVHLATVLPALPLGAYILFKPKGGALHRFLGRAWAALMMITAISSFWLQEGGTLSFIHIFSVVTIVSVPLGVFWIRRGDVVRHRRAMTNTYLGLIVAGLFAFAPGRVLATWLFN
jgi:uncharacterized membrane protein